EQHPLRRMDAQAGLAKSSGIEAGAGRKLCARSREGPAPLRRPTEVRMRLGFGEILVVLVLALLFFGPSKLPQLGSSLGQALRGFKKGLSSIREDMDLEAPAEKPKTPAEVAPRATAPTATTPAAEEKTPAK